MMHETKLAWLWLGPSRPRTRRAFHLLGGVALAAAATMASDAHASVAFAMTIDDVAKAASLVARVTPIEQSSAWEDGRIVTSTRLHVDRVVAGSGAGTEVRVRTLGGVVGDVGQLVEGEATFDPKAKSPSLVFLVPAPNGDKRGPDFAVSGRAQGQLAVEKAGSGERVRVMKTGALVRRITTERIPLAPPPASPMMTALEGRDADDVTNEAARAWERTHAAR